MKSFAILRHGKIKSGRHLVSTGLHNGRGADTPNADPDAPPVEILVGSAKPHRDVMSELAKRKVAKIRKGGVVAVEIVLTASPEWWASKGWTPGCHPTGELAKLLEEWKAAQIEYLKGRFGDRLVSAIYHGDESSPHLQALEVPVVFRTDGREKGELAGREAWRLDSSIDLGSPFELKNLQTEYARQMERFGLVRGGDIETADRIESGKIHKPARVWQAEQAEVRRQLKAEKDAAATDRQTAAASRTRQEALEAGVAATRTQLAQDVASVAGRAAELDQRAAQLAGRAADLVAHEKRQEALQAALIERGAQLASEAREAENRAVGLDFRAKRVAAGEQKLAEARERHKIWYESAQAEVTSAMEQAKATLARVAAWLEEVRAAEALGVKFSAIAQPVIAKARELLGMRPQRSLIPAGDSGGDPKPAATAEERRAAAAELAGLSHGRATPAPAPIDRGTGR